MSDDKDEATAIALANLKVNDNNKEETSPSSYDRWTLLDETTLDYGYLSSLTHPVTTNVADDKEDDNTFYITTAINYTNGPAHMGHAYEAVTSDIIARYHRLTGDHSGGVFFLTGTDEHGQKIAQIAADQGKLPLEICNFYATGFQVLNQRIRITNNDYLRTTSDRHKRIARELWNRCAAAGDIYLDTYSGWYNVREEAFVTDNDALLSNYIDPTSGLPLKKVEEESYFFRMSKYKDRLLQYIEIDNPTFIQPEHHKNLILQRLKSDVDGGLRDLSISRTTFTWGIHVPENFAPNHVMYVWVDALSNYLTGVNGLFLDVDENGEAINQGLNKFWPANVHIIGKDILWFHTVIWPCLLMSANLPLPKTVFAHGFVNDKEGKKMSKSLGNVVDPHDMLDKFHVDSFRWYLAKEASFGGELAFSEDSMRDMHNADLCDNIGNLVNRAANLCLKYCQGIIPNVPVNIADRPVDLSTVLDSYKTKMNAYDLQGGATVAIRAFSEVNGYLQVKEPWNLKGDEHEQTRQVIVKHVLEAIYALSHLLLPFVPTGAKAIFGKLNTPPVSLQELQQQVSSSSSSNEGLLAVGTKIDIGQVLYEKSLSDEERAACAAGGASKKKDSYAEAKRKKDEAKAKAIAASQKGEAAADGGGGGGPDFTKLEIRVGKIVKVWNHEKADKLYCEQIDLGELGGGVREIASGLRPFYSLEEIQDKLVLVVCNLKAQKLVGFESDGMVLAAKSADGDQVELVLAPEGAALGERVLLEELDGTEADYPPFSSTQVRKKKIFETVAADLKTSEDCKATWKGQVLTTSAGPCKVNTLKGASIS